MTLRPPSNAPLIFIGGGARSGKSRSAVQRAFALSTPRAYIVTADPKDDEMHERVRLHQQERGNAFETFEEPRTLDVQLQALQGYGVVVIDCLTLWLSNLMFDGCTDNDIREKTDALLLAAKSLDCPVILVANEVGQGIVPMDALARRFRDEAGRLNQRVAAAADEVELRYFGLPLLLKHAGQLSS